MSTSRVSIRRAEQGDFEFIAALMEEALEPYYGGDHRAHANRIFQTHIEGGIDHIGHFSTEQQIYIAEVAGVKAGMINIVGKRQGTYKISPIIVHPKYRRGYGVGSALLEHGESYARQQDARQMYCTVAEQNVGAYQFFLQKGYVICGRSVDHYRQGITETMMYKRLIPEDVVQFLDHINISVMPFEHAEHASGVTSLILSTLPQHFRGVDEIWIEATFAAHERRLTKDINTKYKLMYVAIEEGRVVGVVAATPKKGEPIKLMPLVADSPYAFAALLSDIPAYLREYGHKLYTHLVPTVGQVSMLQRYGWTLDAVLPAAYHEDYVTQQWGYTYGESFMRNMRVKSRFFNLIKNRTKTLEVRVGYDSIKKIQAGERILLASQTDQMVITVKAVRSYRSFMEMLSHENPDRIAPGMNKADLLGLLQSLYPPIKEKLGVYVFEVEPVK